MAFTAQSIPTLGGGPRSHRAALRADPRGSGRVLAGDLSVSALKHAQMGNHPGPAPPTDLGARRTAPRPSGRASSEEAGPVSGWLASAHGHFTGIAENSERLQRASAARPQPSQGTSATPLSLGATVASPGGEGQPHSGARGLALCKRAGSFSGFGDLGSKGQCGSRPWGA